MGQVIFTPWYCVVDQVRIGRYRLIPFDTTTTNPVDPTLEAQAKIVLRSYLKQPFTPASTRERPVTKCTLILMERGIFDEDEIEVLQYISSFCAVADREFVDSSLYLCTENLKIIVQNFPDPISDPFDPSITTRTKDGGSLTGFSPGFFREVKPWHISNQSFPGNRDYRLKFNESLAQCLWYFGKSRGEKQSLWTNNIFPSIFSFYQANTDGNSLQADCIYSEAAIERLFLGSGHSEENLVRAVLDFLAAKTITFEAFTATARNWQSVTYRRDDNTEAPSASIFEAWIRELIRVRNRYAHGGHEAHGAWVWSLEEHLQLSSFIYPLLLKLFVSAFDTSITFTASDKDMQKIRVIAQLLAETNYRAETAPNSGSTRWGKIISDSRWLT